MSVERHCPCSHVRRPLGAGIEICLNPNRQHVWKGDVGLTHPEARELALMLQVVQQELERERQRRHDIEAVLRQYEERGR